MEDDVWTIYDDDVKEYARELEAKGKITEEACEAYLSGNQKLYRRRMVEAAAEVMNLRYVYFLTPEEVEAKVAEHNSDDFDDDYDYDDYDARKDRKDGYEIDFDHTYDTPSQPIESTPIMTKPIVKEPIVTKPPEPPPVMSADDPDAAEHLVMLVVGWILTALKWFGIFMLVGCIIVALAGAGIIGPLMVVLFIVKFFIRAARGK